MKIKRAFDEAGTIVSVGYMNRYRATVDRVRQLISANDPVLVNGQWIGGIPGPAWWRNFDQSGGQFVEQCTHIVDLARYIAGEITEVSAYAADGFVTDVPDYSVHDAQVINARFASGAIGNFTTACYARGFGDVGLRVSSRDVQCTLSSGAMNLRIDRRDAEPQQQPSQDDVFVIQMRTFIEAVKNQDASQIRSGYDDAIQTLRVTLAANESVKTNAPVKV